MHTTYGTVSSTKVAFDVFLLFDLARSITITKHRTNTNVTFTEQVMNCFQEVSELYDGSLHKIHYFFYSSDITTNETFKGHEAMKQEDILSFVNATEKEIHEHEEGGHWTVVNCNTLPNKSHPIKSKWMLKRKRKPDGEILKHKSILCTYGGMQ